MWVILKESVQLKGLDTTGFDLEGPKLRQVPMPEHGVTSKSTKGPGAPWEELQKQITKRDTTKRLSTSATISLQRMKDFTMLLKKNILLAACCWASHESSQMSWGRRHRLGRAFQLSMPYKHAPTTWRVVQLPGFHLELWRFHDQQAMTLFQKTVGLAPQASVQIGRRRITKLCVSCFDLLGGI